MQVYLWARRVLGWDATQYSIWSGSDEAVHQFGMVVWVGLASLYHVSDHSVATTGLVSIALWSIVLACITGPSMWWLVILASLLGSLEASIEPALRTLITSIPDTHDIGKILAFLGLLESIWLIVDRSLYTFLYNTFVESFPQVNKFRCLKIMKNKVNFQFLIADQLCSAERHCHGFDCGSNSAQTRLVKTTELKRVLIKMHLNMLVFLKFEF